MEARMVPDWIGTYRGFKYEFVGLPKQPPDVLSKTESRGTDKAFTTTKVFVSWNGATEVKNWVYYKSTKDGKTQVRIGSKPREGFETSFEWEGYASYIVVEGMDKTGNTLGASKVIKTEEPTNVEAEDVEEELQWQIDAGLGLIHPGSETRLHPELFFEEPTKAFFAFLAGLAFSPLLLFVIYKFRQRRAKASWWKSGLPFTQPGSDRYAGDYDETTLDDLNLDGHRRDDDSDAFDLTDDEDHSEQGDAEYGRLSARNPYVRQVSSVSSLN